MKAFIWDQTFVTGIEKVDEQHHFLVDLMNRFGDALIASKSLDDGELASIFGQLAEYAQYHFSTEHNLMLEWGVAPEHRARHDRLHESFIRQVSAMWNERSTMSNPSEVLHGFLCAWLAFHVLGEDQIMGRQIALIRQGKSPEEAFALASKPLDNSTAGLLEALSNLYGVLAVADVYDALISRRVYKEGMSHEKAVSIIIDGKGSHFDADIVDAFVELQDDFKAIAARFADTDTDMAKKKQQLDRLSGTEA